MRIIKIWWCVLFSNSKNEYKIARYALLNNVSYLYPEADKKNAFLGFYEIKSIWCRSKSKSPLNFKKCKTIVFDRSYDYKSKRTKYLQHEGVRIDGFISKSNLLEHRAEIGYLSLLVTYSIGITLAFIILLKKQNRVNLTLLIRALFETQILCKLVGQDWSGSIHDFVQYDIDSNAIYLILKYHLAKSVTYHKYPSPGPLLAHNSRLITDVLCVNHPYHIEEVKAYEKTIHFSELKRVAPEGFVDYKSCYSWPSITTQNRIGYYSHGGWVRQQDGHADDGLDIASRELKLLEKLSDIISNNPEYSLVVFLHPREKETKQFIKTHNYYHKIFGSNERIEYSNGSSTRLFNEAKVGIGVYSTILFERLICGLPTLINSPIDTFPVVNSKLNRIIVSDETIENSLKNALNQQVEEFFTSNELMDYIEPSIIKSCA